MRKYFFIMAFVGIVGCAGWGLYWFLMHAGADELGSLPPANTLQELTTGETITTEVNAKAPGFAGIAFDGTEVRSIDFIGQKVVLVEFWSVFCTSCVQEMPHLGDLYRRYHDQGLEVVGVCTDYFGPERVRKFLSRLDQGPPYPIIQDREQKISKAFKVDQLPVTVLIDSSGWIRMYHLGFKPGNEKMIEAAAVKWIGRIKGSSETVGPVGGRTQVAVASPNALVRGASLPEFKGVDMDGARIDAVSYRGGRPLVIFAWSLFCQPCRKEMPYIAKLAQETGATGPIFISVNVDSNRLREQVRKFLLRYPLPFPTVMDADADPPGSIAARLGIVYTPTLIMANAAGQVSAIVVGDVTAEDIAREISKLSQPGS